MLWSRFMVSGFAVIIMVTAASAQRRGGDPKAAAVKNPVAATTQSVTTGRALYNKNCRHCHGLKGLGDGPLAPKNPKPSNLTDGTWDHGSTDGEIYAVIWNGAPAKDSEMKPMKGTLREMDVWHIVNFIRSIGPKAGTERRSGVPADSSKPAPGAKPSTAKPAAR